MKKKMVFILWRHTCCGADRLKIECAKDWRWRIYHQFPKHKGDIFKFCLVTSGKTSSSFSSKNICKGHVFQQWWRSPEKRYEIKTWGHERSQDVSGRTSPRYRRIMKWVEGVSRHWGQNRVLTLICAMDGSLVNPANPSQNNFNCIELQWLEQWKSLWY